MFEVFEHTADIGLRVRAGSLEELFAEAARGLFALIVSPLEQVQPSVERRFALPADQADYMLFDWLNALLWTFDAERMLFSRFEVQLGEQGLAATAHGEPMDPARHRMEHEVKAITYHGLRVEPSPDGWLAEVIVDI
jgi:SHS2 domain-containing protein